MMRTEKISRRPMSIMAEQAHLTSVGSEDQEVLGPTPVSSEGPTLQMQLRVILTELTVPMSQAMSRVNMRPQRSMKIVRKARSVTRFCWGMF